MGRKLAGPLLRQTRLAAGITQKAAAAELGVSASTLCDFEKGHHQFRGLALRYRGWIAQGCPIAVEEKTIGC